MLDLLQAYDAFKQPGSPKLGIVAQLGASGPPIRKEAWRAKAMEMRMSYEWSGKNDICWQWWDWYDQTTTNFTHNYTKVLVFGHRCKLLVIALMFLTTFAYNRKDINIVYVYAYVLQSHTGLPKRWIPCIAEYLQYRGVCWFFCVRWILHICHLIVQFLPN